MKEKEQRRVTAGVWPGLLVGWRSRVEGPVCAKKMAGVALDGLSWGTFNGNNGCAIPRGKPHCKVRVSYMQVIFIVTSLKRSLAPLPNFPGNQDACPVTFCPSRFWAEVTLPAGKTHIYLGCLKIKSIAIELPFIWPQSTLTFFALHC